MSIGGKSPYILDVKFLSPPSECWLTEFLLIKCTKPVQPEKDSYYLRKDYHYPASHSTLLRECARSVTSRVLMTFLDWNFIPKAGSTAIIYFNQPTMLCGLWDPKDTCGHQMLVLLDLDKLSCFCFFVSFAWKRFNDVIEDMATSQIFVQRPELGRIQGIFGAAQVQLG
jgi:hypothetical protein